MGWKTLKERYNIEHIVQLRADSICIGSSLIYDLIKVNPKTGKLRLNESFYSKSKDEYPALVNASPEDILDALNASDMFSSDLVVYSYDDSGVTEHLCEEYGYPNVTHDGHLMFENRFTTDRTQAIKWAMKDALAGVKTLGRQVRQDEIALERLKTDLKFQKDRVASLKSQYPEITQEVNE